MLENYLEAIIKPLLQKPESLKIIKSNDEMGILLTIQVDKWDMGRVVGKEGSTAKAVRTILSIYGLLNQQKIGYKILEPEGSTFIKKSKEN